MYGYNITTLSLYKWNLFFVRNIVVRNISIYDSVGSMNRNHRFNYVHLTMHNKSIMCNRLAKFMCRKNIYHSKLITAIIFEKKSFSVENFVDIVSFICVW